MKVHHRNIPGYAHPDLFDWLADRDRRTAEPAVQWVARRFGVPIHTAMTLARHAGFGEQTR